MTVRGGDTVVGSAEPATTLTVVVLAGGRSQRFGGDKLTARLDGEPLLDRTLAGLPPSVDLIVVGPERDLRRPARFLREDPPYAGPAAAIAAGLTAALQGSATRIVVLPGDAPYASRAVRPLLAALTAERRAAVAVDDQGWVQPLHLAFDRVGARAWLTAAGAEIADRSARQVLDSLNGPLALVRLGSDHLRDVDTTADLAALAADTAP